MPAPDQINLERFRSVEHMLGDVSVGSPVPRGATFPVGNQIHSMRPEPIRGLIWDAHCGQSEQVSGVVCLGEFFLDHARLLDNGAGTFANPKVDPGVHEGSAAHGYEVRVDPYEVVLGATAKAVGHSVVTVRKQPGHIVGFSCELL